MKLILIYILTILRSLFSYKDISDARSMDGLLKTEAEVFEMDDAFALTNETAVIDKDIIYAADIDLSGKKISCLGDSLTEGVGSDKNEYGNYISYCDYLQNALNCNVKNYGIGGSSFNAGGYEPFVKRMYSIPRDSDIIIVMGGYNDYFEGTERYGNYDEEGTYRCAVKASMEYFSSEYPDSDIFYVLMYKPRETANNAYPFEAYIKAQKDMANEYGINLINIYDTEFLDSNNEDVKNEYFYDSVHLKNKGYELLGNRIAVELLKYYKDK